MENKLILGDCMEVMKTLPDNSFDAIITDPPYFEIKGDFDFEYKDFQDYLNFVESCAKEFHRILKTNGSIIWFGHAKRIAYSQVIFDKYFNLLNSCVWVKPDCRTQRCDKDIMRAFAPISERYLFYEHKNSTENKTGLTAIFSNKDCFKSIKEYMRGELDKFSKANNLTKTAALSKLGEITGTKNVVERHYFSDSQYMFPVEHLYKLLQTTGFFQREYEDLRAEYEDLRAEYEDLRRFFEIQSPHGYDVLSFSQEAHITKNYDHPTQKPLSLMRVLIKTVTKKDALVLDPFAGSGTTAAAAVLEDRRFITIEKEQKYYEIALKRIQDTQNKRDGMLF